jgi:DNA-directed RNA polymerase specialized sigma24 family protein
VYKEKVKQVLRILKPKEAQLVLLKHIRNYDMERIADELDYTDANSAKTQLYKTMMKLRKQIKK